MCWGQSIFQSSISDAYDTLKYKYLGGNCIPTFKANLFQFVISNVCNTYICIWASNLYLPYNAIMNRNWFGTGPLLSVSDCFLSSTRALWLEMMGHSLPYAKVNLFLLWISNVDCRNSECIFGPVTGIFHRIPPWVGVGREQARCYPHRTGSCWALACCGVLMEMRLTKANPF